MKLFSVLALLIAVLFVAACSGGDEPYQPITLDVPPTLIAPSLALPTAVPSSPSLTVVETIQSQDSGSDDGYVYDVSLIGGTGTGLGAEIDNYLGGLDSATLCIIDTTIPTEDGISRPVCPNDNEIGGGAPFSGDPNVGGGYDPSLVEGN